MESGPWVRRAAKRPAAVKATTKKVATTVKPMTVQRRTEPATAVLQLAQGQHKRILRPAPQEPGGELAEAIAHLMRLVGQIDCCPPTYGKLRLPP